MKNFFWLSDDWIIFCLWTINFFRVPDNMRTRDNKGKFEWKIETQHNREKFRQPFMFDSFFIFTPRRTSWKLSFIAFEILIGELLMENSLHIIRDGCGWKQQSRSSFSIYIQLVKLGVAKCWNRKKYQVPFHISLLISQTALKLQRRRTKNVIQSKQLTLASYSWEYCKCGSKMKWEIQSKVAIMFRHQSCSRWLADSINFLAAAVLHSHASNSSLFTSYFCVYDCKSFSRAIFYLIFRCFRCEIKKKHSMWRHEFVDEETKRGRGKFCFAIDEEIWQLATLHSSRNV